MKYEFTSISRSQCSHSSLTRCINLVCTRRGLIHMLSVQRHAQSRRLQRVLPSSEDEVRLLEFAGTEWHPATRTRRRQSVVVTSISSTFDVKSLGDGCYDTKNTVSSRVMAALAAQAGDRIRGPLEGQTSGFESVLTSAWSWCTHAWATGSQLIAYAGISWPGPRNDGVSLHEDVLRNALSARTSHAITHHNELQTAGLRCHKKLATCCSRTYND